MVIKFKKNAPLIFDKFISLGIHIGDIYYSKHFKSIINNYVLCIRNNYLIIDLTLPPMA